MEDQKSLNLKEIERAVRELDPKVSKKSDEFRAAVILLSGSLLGNTSAKIISFTGYPREFVRSCARNLRKNQIWSKTSTFCEWVSFEEEQAVTAFWLDTLVALGSVKKEFGASVSDSGVPA